MRRPFALVVTLLLLTGCGALPQDQHPAPPVGPEASDPPTTVQEPTPSVASPETSLRALGGDPIDWVRGEPLPARSGVCEPRPGPQSPLAVHVRQVTWREHPQAPEPFWVPAVTLTLCNPSDQATKNLFLRLERAGGDTWSWAGSIGPITLQPGDGLGPFRYFASEGLPARMLGPEGELPDWRFRVTLDGLPLAEFGRSGGVEGPEVTREVLVTHAWDHEQITTADGVAVDLYLYAPDAQYSVTTDPSCGAAEGQVGARASRWGVYSIRGEGEPVRLLDLGRYNFGGGRGLRVENAPALGVTFLGLEQYGSCAVPMVHDLFAYDHATGEGYVVMAQDREGKTRMMTVAAFTVTPEGKLENRFYLNAGDEAGWHTVIYRWVPGERTWVEESRTVTQQP